MPNVDPGFGLEDIERKACMILYSELNAEIDAQQDAWDDKDFEFNALTGVLPANIVIEHIAENNFYYGHRPSLIEADVENYPNVSTMAYEALPTVEKTDQFPEFNVTLDVELMCKSDDSESEVNRRTHRTLEAVNNVLVRNETLGGISLGFDDDAQLIMTDVFVRVKETSKGETFFWQAARLRYNLTKHAKRPS